MPDAQRLHRTAPPRQKLCFGLSEQGGPMTCVQPRFRCGKFVLLVSPKSRRAQRRGVRRPTIALRGGVNRGEPRKCWERECLRLRNGGGLRKQRQARQGN